MFNSTDIKAMEGNLQPKIKEAHGLTQQARAWFGADLILQPALSAKCIGQMDVRLVMHVHGFQKKVKTRKQFDSLGSIARQLATDVEAAGGGVSQCPWIPQQAAPAESAPCKLKQSLRVHDKRQP